jgi:hypothetical protein
MELKVVVAAAAMLGCCILAPAATLGQQPAASPSPSASPTPAENPAGPNTEGGFDLTKLTPEQQAALKAAIIKISQNPVGNITAIPFQNNSNYGVGPYTRWQYNLNIQPVVPFMLSTNLSLIARTIFPIVNQPSFAPPGVCASPAGCGSTFGLSDIQEQLFFAPKTKPGALIWGLGPIFQFPSASPQVLGTAKWSVGPAAVALVMPGRFVTGMLVTQLWSFAGKTSTPPVNSGLFQPFFNYNIPGGQFSLTTAPIITVNYDAFGNQKWTVPLGGGGSYTFKLGDQVMQLSAVYYTSIVRPITAPQTTLRITWSLLFPLKRGINIQQLLQEAQ